MRRRARCTRWKADGIEADYLDLAGHSLRGLMDPPRPGAMQAAERGLHGGAVSGADIDGMDAAQLAAAIDDVAVFARVTPSHKVRIVRAL